METPLTLVMAMQMFNIAGFTIFLVAAITMGSRWYWGALWAVLLAGNVIGFASHFI